MVRSTGGSWKSLIGWKGSRPRTYPFPSLARLYPWRRKTLKLPDAQLVQTTLRGDDAAFDELVSRYRSRAFHLALSKVRSREAALDIAQEAFVQAYISLGTLKQPERFAAWLGGIVSHACGTYLRRSREMPVPAETIEILSQSHARLGESELDATAAREAIDRLPNGTRSAAILYFIEEMKQTEIAEFLGISLAAVKSRIRDARASLQKEMIHMVKQTAKIDISKANESAPVIRIAYTIIQQAILDGASEILLEPGLNVWTSPDATQPEVLQAIAACEETGASASPKEPGLRIAYKMGEDWRDVMPLPDYVREPIVERFKMMADVDLACTDKSQEGRIPIRYDNKNYMLTLSTAPTPLGEKVTMQLEAA